MTHVEHEDHPWGIHIPDHPGRTDSPGFQHAKRLAKAIAKATPTVDFWGTDSIQMHHGGSLYLLDEAGWFMVKNVAGIEWSAQFAAEPAKVELLRRNAERLYAMFPKSEPAMVELGYPDTAILHAPIIDAGGVGAWVDSVFNSCVPIPAARHTGVLSPTVEHGGCHHYPTPITDIELVMHDDFTLWVVDDEGQPAAVVPVAPRGSGVAEVRVAYATPGTRLSETHLTLDAAGKVHHLAADHPLAQQAFAKQ